ncbi:MAG TPA: ATP-binding cassette domain-containing protein, partial [Polyangiaceae bacterium]|nr:ATP-binding cassette domain-containing protein [Polyangiaceae bacterium]
PRAKRSAAVSEAMQRAGVTHMAGTVIQHLSKGYRQRVALADALVANPPLLILDEPTAGLDPNQIREVRALVKELGQDRTVLLSTHILSEVEATCERAIVIDRGKLVAEGTIDELRARQRASTVSLRVRDPHASAEAAVSGIPGVSVISATRDDGATERRILTLALDTEVDPDATIERIAAGLINNGIGVHALVPEKASLEQIFSELTRHERENETRAEKKPEASS